MTNGTTATEVSGTSGLNPTDITVFGSEVLFAGKDASNNIGLWMWTGTGAPQELTGISGAVANLAPSDITVYNGKVLFSGLATTGGRELFVTNGTAAGTTRLTVAGSSNYRFNPTDLELYNGQVLFQGQNSSSLQTLWTMNSSLVATEIAPISGARPTYGLIPVDLTTIEISPPNLAGTVSGQTTTSETSVRPFAHVTIGDANANGTDTLTITVGGAGGTLSGTGLSRRNRRRLHAVRNGGRDHQRARRPVFTPKAGAPNTTSTTTFTLSDLSSAGGAPVVDSTTSVIDNDPAVAPTISGTASGQTTTSEAPVKPFAGM